MNESMSFATQVCIFMWVYNAHHKSSKTERNRKRVIEAHRTKLKTATLPTAKINWKKKLCNENKAKNCRNKFCHYVRVSYTHLTTVLSIW